MTRGDGRSPLRTWGRAGRRRATGRSPGASTAELAWILGVAAGHLFSYHAARAIDAAADPVPRRR